MQQLDISKYPDDETRIAREKFTAKLRKICAKLDSGPTQIVKGKNWFTGADAQVTATARGLWVFGSYARGALTCGDLDLILQLDYASNELTQQVLTKSFVGVHPHVRVYHGTPKENGTNLSLPGAVLIWEPGMDWESALMRIEPNTTAGRFVRPGDTLPFKPEQDGLSRDHREHLEKLREDGVLSWRFVPLSTITQSLSPYEAPRGHCGESWVLKCFSEKSIMKRKLAPVVLGFARQLATESFPGEHIQWDRIPNIRVGTVPLYVGTLPAHDLLLNSYERTAVAFIPALSTKGPNGFWLVERGPNHPLVKALEGVGAWVHTVPDGAMSTSAWSTGEGATQAECTGLELYASQEDAQFYADMFYENDVLDNPSALRAVPRFVTGNELIQAIALVDALMPTKTETIPLTYTGERYCVAEHTAAVIPSFEVLADQLRSALEDYAPTTLAPQ